MHAGAAAESLCDRAINFGHMVVLGKTSKRLAPPRNTKDRKHLQSTQTIVNRHNSQSKHQALSKGRPMSQGA